MNNKIIPVIIALFLLTTCKTKEKTILKDENAVLNKELDTIFVQKDYQFSDFHKAYNVKDFGAMGNGLNNDTESIMQCFKAVEKDSGSIAYFPKGTYLVSRTNIPGKSWCLLGVDNLKIVGENRKKTIIKLASKQKNFTRILVLNNHKNISIKNITIDGNVSKQINPDKPNEHLGGIFINHSENIHISDCDFINTGGDGISIRGTQMPSKNIKIEYCYFDNNKRNGITLGSGFDHIEISHCIFGSNIDDSPIDTEPESGICQNVNIHHNKIHTNSILTLGGNKKVTGKNFILQDNILNNCSIFIYKADSVIVRNNKLNISLPAKAAITCHSGNNKIYIYNNKIKINNKPAFYFVKTRYSTNAPHHITINNNHIKVNGKNTNAFDIRGANHIKIINNTISGNESNVGIYCLSNFSMDNIVISNNTIKGFNKGIKITPLKNNTINNIVINKNKFLSQGKMQIGIDCNNTQNLLKKINISNNIYSDSLKILIHK
jgi:hypothetical protein